MTELERALEALHGGRPVVIPTDTVYGIAAMPSIPCAIASVFAAKGRPEEKALPVLAASLEQLEEVVLFDERARRLAHRFWPGPLTIVLPRSPRFSYDLGGPGGDGQRTVAVRIPDCRIALDLLERSGPLAVTSANRSGEAPATTVADARASLASIEVMVDGGRCPRVPSTVVALLNGPKVVREGAISSRQIAHVLSE